jgi:hypothetical protein
MHYQCQYTPEILYMSTAIFGGIFLALIFPALLTPITIPHAVYHNITATPTIPLELFVG